VTESVTQPADDAAAYPEPRSEAPSTGQPAVDAALARFAERLPDGLDAHVEAGARLAEALRAALADLDPAGTL
jgi:hypothetical protein